MSNSKFTAEFRAEALKQITERGHSVQEVAKRLGVSDKSLYLWLKQFRDRHGALPQPTEQQAMKQEIARLKSELKRTTEERDILKKAAAYFAKVSE